MNKRFTYKELTLLLGVLVAIIILIIIWSQLDPTLAAEIGRNEPSKWLSPSVGAMTDKVIDFIQVLR